MKVGFIIIQMIIEILYFFIICAGFFVLFYLMDKIKTFKNMLT